MDPQLKRGLLEVLVLSVLTNGPSYGYRIIKDLAPCLSVSESTLYPILKRLETGALVSASSEEYNGRLRRMFAITSAGRQRISDFLDEWKTVMDVYDFISKGKDHDKD